MKVGIPKEIHPGERRVAATTETVTRLKKQGFEVMVESGAGVERGRVKVRERPSRSGLASGGRLYGRSSGERLRRSGSALAYGNTPRRSFSGSGERAGARSYGGSTGELRTRSRSYGGATGKLSSRSRSYGGSAGRSSPGLRSFGGRRR